MFHSRLLLSSSLSPLSLFAAGEQGAWYDPSDFSTMFQDAAGITPVTAVEQPVGLIRDKSGRGNHASQTTSTSRPVLSARVNLLTYTEQFDNAAWTKTGLNAFGSGSVANTTDTTDPNGGNTADFIQESTATSGHGVVSAAAAFVVGETYTVSVYAKQGVGTRNLTIGSGNSGIIAFLHTFNLINGTVVSGSGASIQSVGNGWYRCVVSRAAASSGNTTIALQMRSGTTFSYTGDGTSGIYLWGADLRSATAGSSLPPYQRVGAATAGTSSAAGTGDYDTTGFPYYLSFDGTDDFLVTGTINPGSVDKAQVFAGVRKLSDAADGVVVELSVSGSVNSGTFTMIAASTTGGDYFFRSRGDGTTTGATATTYIAPITNVLSGLGDISGDSAILRVNGSQIAQNTADQGSGNFGSYPLYIGRLGGTTLPFNGRLFGLIVRFSAANMSDAEIAQTEDWMEVKTFGKNMVLVYSDELTTALGELITAADGDQIYMTVSYV